MEKKQKKSKKRSRRYSRRILLVSADIYRGLQYAENTQINHCTLYKFVLGGQFKKSELFSEQKKIIGVL